VRERTAAVSHFAMQARTNSTLIFTQTLTHRFVASGLQFGKGNSMRLGDMIDDHCSRCKRTTDHAIVAMTGNDVVKVVCRTCNSEHKYRHNKTGKKEMTAEQAFQKVLGSVTGQMGEPSAGEAKKKGK